MIAALEFAGVIFVEENGEGRGVRLLKAKSESVVELTERIEHWTKQSPKSLWLARRAQA